MKFLAVINIFVSKIQFFTVERNLLTGIRKICEEIFHIHYEKKLFIQF